MSSLEYGDQRLSPSADMNGNLLRLNDVVRVELNGHSMRGEIINIVAGQADLVVRQRGDYNKVKTSLDKIELIRRSNIKGYS